MVKKSLLIYLPFLIIFLGFIYVLVSFDLWDYDFWWHISTGRYIVETGTIPNEDPFSYTEALKENKNLFPERKDFLLKQYWLSQVIFYLIYDYVGPKGIILLRAVILTSTLFLVFLRLREWKVNFYVSFIFLFLLYLQLIGYTGERPVLFTILLTVVVFILLERFREKKGKGLFLLCPLMLLWSNLHGGFIIGNIIIFLYMLCEGIKMLFKKTHLTRGEITLFYTVTTLSLIFSYINPTGWDAFFIALSPQYKHFEVGIQEYQSPFYFYKERLSPINYGYIILMLLFPLILLLRRKRLDLNHILLLLGLFIMALKTGRYVVYYASIASMVLGRETNLLIDGIFKMGLKERAYKKITFAFSVVAVLSSLIFLISIFRFEALRFDIAKGYSVPKGAVDFIEQERISGNILNDGGYGGYITWRLYPWKKTFIDTRWLNYTVRSEYGWMMSGVESIYSERLPEGKKPLWKRLLEHYNINFILLPILDVYGNVPPLILKLADDSQWVPVYCDPISVIFIKNIPENYDIIKNFRLSKEDVYNRVIYQASLRASRDRRNPTYLLSLGETFYKMGRLQDALTAYQYALRRSPKKEHIRKRIDEIEAQIERQAVNEGEGKGK